MASKEKFTLRNYVKELKKCWIFLIIFTILGAGAGIYYAASKPNGFEAETKIVVHNSSVENGTTTSPYAVIGELISSEELMEDKELAEYKVAEKPFGVFTITATDADEQKAINTVNTVAKKAKNAVKAAFDDYSNYRFTVVERAEKTTPTVTTLSRIITIAIATVGALALAMIIVFVKFDYSAER